MKTKKIFSILFVFVILSGVEGFAQKKSTKKKSKTKPETTQEKKVTVSGNVTQTYPYCGGARPPKEILEQLAQPKPFIGKKFHVITGEKNTEGRKIILSFTSDSSGNFSFKLPAGNYSIILDEQVAAPDSKKFTSQFVKMDETCYKDWWAKPYYLLEVGSANIKGLNFSFNHKCFIQSDIPCLQYDGPMPP